MLKVSSCFSTLSNGPNALSEVKVKQDEGFMAPVQY
jgi:hypothetical protein